MNTFGTIFRFTSFGESHGPAQGGVIDGLPAGLRIDFGAIDRALAARAPAAGSGRREPDAVEFLSGIFEGVSTGTPLAFIIRNADARSTDYEPLRHAFRPGHADFTYSAKYGIRDYRGGGRSSARETVCRVVAGAIAMQFLQLHGIAVSARIESLGGVALPPECTSEEYRPLLDEARREHDTLGGVVALEINGLPAGLGEPVFGKFTAVLAAAMMSIPAARGVEFGDGFAAASMRGSRCIDTPLGKDANGRLRCDSNHSGGMLGGITTGMPLTARVAFKPIATMPERTLGTIGDDGKPTELCMRGRHDVCAVPRAVPVVTAMAAIVCADMLLLSRCSRL